MNRPIVQVWVEKFPCCHYGTDIWDTIWAWNYAEEFPLSTNFNKLLEVKFWGVPTQKVVRVYGILEDGIIRVTVRDLSDVVYETGLSTSDGQVFIELPLNKLIGKDGIIVIEGKRKSGDMPGGIPSFGLFKKVSIIIGAHLSNCFWIEKLPTIQVWAEKLPIIQVWVELI